MATERESVFRHIRRMALRDANGLTDGQLLESFLVQSDEAAFEALVRRHGPMVLAVCRRVLKNQHDAEDAFQASFLVFLRRAASIARPELLGNWLYGVAYRTAMKSKVATSRRRAKEKQLANRSHRQPSEEGILDDLLVLVDQELHRLPEKYRAAVVLCDLQGLSRKEAANRLGWPIGTLNWRLATGRTALAQKLTGHGLPLAGGALAVALSRDSVSAAVPPSLLSSTMKAGTLAATGSALPAGVVSAAVASLTEGVVKAMFWSKLKIGMVMLLGIGMVGTGTAFLPQGTRAAGQRPLHPERGADHSVAERPFKEDTSAAEGTSNFRVHAPTAQLARRIAQAAERYRREKALEWLGKELPRWSEPCPIQVQITADGSKSATSFVFSEGKVTRQHMWLQGPLDRILKADLPHEVTHIILAHHFGSPVCRWADEGAAILSADDVERDRNDRALQQILSQSGRFVPLRQLFAYWDYPKDVTALLAEGYSFTRFLTESRGRKIFLRFIAEGMRDGWDKALRQHYGYATVDTAEAVWLQDAKQPRPTPTKESKSNDRPNINPGSTNSQAPGNEVDRKLALAFGDNCKAINEAMLKISLPHLILATNQITFEPGARVNLAPCWYARFGKDQNDSEGAGVTTIYSDQACIRFDGPVGNITDLARRKVISIEPSGRVRVAFSAARPKANP